MSDLNNMMRKEYCESQRPMSFKIIDTFKVKKEKEQINKLLVNSVLKPSDTQSSHTGHLGLPHVLNN